MGRYTKQDVIDLVRENDVEFIRLQFSDLFGTMKNVAITARQLEKALDNKCTFDGSSVDGFVRIEESDMYLYPDLDSFAIFPWNAGGKLPARKSRLRWHWASTRRWIPMTRHAATKWWMRIARLLLDISIAS